MEMKLWGFVLCILSTGANFISAGRYARSNKTFTGEHRQKRGLIFEGGGIIKLIVGPIMPLDFGDPISWRSFITSYNLHGGHYNLPTTPLYPWDKWEDTFARELKQMKNDFQRKSINQKDDSRLFLYAVLEHIMSRNMIDGKTCLLRLICENAQTHEHVGLFTEIFNIILTPRSGSLEDIYYQAYVVGKADANCMLHYKNCPKGANVFDDYLKIF